MSMPSFPEGATNLTCEEAFNMLLGSIAMEEMALGHIMNAEGEKIQYVLGTLPRKPCQCTTPKEVLEVNRSVSDLLEQVAYNQLLLKGKLRQVLEGRKECISPPPEPECPPSSPRRCTCVWKAMPGRLWRCGCPLPWRGGSVAGCWQGSTPVLLHLCPGTIYSISAAFRLKACRAGPVRVVMRSSCRELMVCEACAGASGQVLSLVGSTILAPVPPQPTPETIQWVLDSREEVTVERAVLHITFEH